jgi:hypothetical protein
LTGLFSLFTGDEASGSALLSKFSEDAILGIYAKVDKTAPLSLNKEGSLDIVH